MQQNNNQPWFMDGGQSNKIKGGDLTMVQDDMYSEALAYKKCKVYASRFQDPALQSMAASYAEHHRQHFDALQNYLESKQ